MIFLASGTAPFTLAAGRAAAKDVFLSSADLADGQGRPGEARLVSVPSATVTLSPLGDAGAPTRNIVLWAVLLAATAVLAGLAWVLWRQQAAQAPRDPS